MIKTNQPILFSCRSHARRMVLAMLILAFVVPDVAQAQVDVVITRRKDSEQTLRRKGTIVEWKGMSLTINTDGIGREIDNDQIVQVQTNWGDDYRSGLAELRTGKTQIAIIKFQEALRNETRPWVQRIIRAKLVDAFQSIEKHTSAVEQFLLIVREDPQTRFLHLAPLPWTGSDNSLGPAAQKWIESPDSVTQLIGASWLLGGPNRNQGIKLLEELSKGIDPGIKNLAIAQLWRTRVSLNPKQVEVWQGIVDQMPRDLRAGPYLVLAEAQARTGMSEMAIVNLMRIPILYAEQKTLSAAALYRSVNLLHNKGSTEQAQSILNELVTYYPQTIWAQQATH
jgi:tetratricopeptide (TPR) repeat protein